MHAARGQTVGKIAAKLKVVNDRDNSPITAATAYTRALVFAGPRFISGLALFFAAMTAGSVTSVSSPSFILMQGANVLVGLWGLANVLAALFDKDRQRALHDRICGTRVIDLS